MGVEVFIATSVDGFIARKDGSIDWLAHPDYGLEGEDYGYNAFTANVSCMLMGSGTFRVVSAFDDWPYTVPVYVLSRSLKELPASLEGKAFLRASHLKDTVQALQNLYDGTIYLDGGMLIQSGLREGLIDRMCITRIPVLLGDGLPLFGPLEEDLHLKHVDTKSFDSGLTQSTYQVIRPQTRSDT